MSGFKAMGTLEWVGKYKNQPTIITTFFNGAIVYSYGRLPTPHPEDKAIQPVQWHEVTKFYLSHCRPSPLQQALEFVGAKE